MATDLELDAFANSEELEEFEREDEDGFNGDEFDGDEPLDEEEELDGADELGSEIDLAEEGLTGSGNEVRVQSSLDFLDEEGAISVMDANSPENCFEYLPELLIESIVVAGYRIRQNPSVVSTHQTIKSTGLLEPITVAPTMTKGVYILVHGLKRLMVFMKLGRKTIPAIVNNKIKSSEISIVEALYNFSTPYTMKECRDYINYLETEKHIKQPSLFEMLLQWDNGDYAKFKDIINDGDPDIINKLFNTGEFNIKQAFQALEKRRKKESREEKLTKTIDKAYNNGEETEGLVETGDTSDGDGESLSDEEITELIQGVQNMDSELEDTSLDELVEQGKKMDGFEDYQQDVDNRERIDPAIRKAVMAKHLNTCQLCLRGGEDYVDILDCHHIVPVFLGGRDSEENSVPACLCCHKQVHLYAFNQLTIPKTKSEEELKLYCDQRILMENSARKNSGVDPMDSETEEQFRKKMIGLYDNEQMKYKRIVKMGNVIREGMQKKGMTLKKAKEQHNVNRIGREKPGVKNTVD